MPYEYDFAVFHCEQDTQTAIQIATYLENNGNNLKGYIGDRDAEPGKPIFQDIERAITNSKYIILLMSNTAVENSMLLHKLCMSLQHRLDNPEIISTIIPVLLPGFNAVGLPQFIAFIHPISFQDDAGFWNRMLRLF